MADLALLASVTSSVDSGLQKMDVIESIEQATLIAAVAMDAGTPVYIDSNGKFAKGDGSAAGTAAVYGVTTSKVAAEQAVTAIAKGVIGGFDLSAVAFNTSLYVSDTEGKIATTAAEATVDTIVGRVIPIRSQSTGAPSKAVQVNL